MKGNVIATGKVEITREAKFSGMIKCKNIYVEKGAYFDADVNLVRESSEKVTLVKTSKNAKEPESSKNSIVQNE